MPIPGLRRLDHVEALRQSFCWCMDEQERDQLDAIAAKLQVAMPANPFSSS